jgi:hypothetical protein
MRITQKITSSEQLTKQAIREKTSLYKKIYNGCGKLASFFHIAVQFKKGS